MRQQHPVLRRGSLAAPLWADAHSVVLVRRLGEVWALTATNNDSQARTVTVVLPPGLDATRLHDVLGGAAASVPLLPAVDGRLTLNLPPLFGRVLVTR